MEYREAPGIENAERRLVFPIITWLTKKKFEEYLELQTKSSTNYQIHPYFDLIDGEFSINNRIFIGKSIPSDTSEGVAYSGYGVDRNLEIVGTVFRNDKGKWQLNVTHGSRVHEIKNDFLVLNIEDANSFYWSKTTDDNLSKFALRGAIDEQTCEYFYIGKPCSSYEEKNRPRYLRGGWQLFQEDIRPVIGKVHRGHKCLYAPVNGLELAFKEYDILCLKPTPAPLRILCRSLIRSLTGGSNSKIENINKNESGVTYLPNPLIDLLKYPSHLNVGEYMLQDEKLVSDDGQFELIIHHEELMFNDLLTKKKIKYDYIFDFHYNGYVDDDEDEAEALNQERNHRCYHDDEPDRYENYQYESNESESEENQFYNDNYYYKLKVQSIWLHRFQVAYLCNKHSSVKISYHFFDKSPEYKLVLLNENGKPNLIVEAIDTDGNVSKFTLEN